MKINLPRPIVYTVAEFACLFAVSPRLVRNLIRKGEIPALRFGRSYRIPRKVADAYLARTIPIPPRPLAKPRGRERDDGSTGFLFPIDTLQ
jgi:excisionase family DNA binding protein